MTDKSCRIPRPNLILVDLRSSNHSRGRHNGRSANMGAAKDDAARRDPRTRIDEYGSRDQRHVTTMRVAPGGDERLLRDDSVSSNNYVILVMNPDTLADPTPMADAELPGESHTRARAENHTLTDLGTEQAKHGDPQV